MEDYRLASWYRGKKVFVTGHTGFKGAWLTLWLLSLGAEVAGYSLGPPTDPALFSDLHIKDRIRHTPGDVRDGENLTRALLDFEPEIVFHLAAQALVRVSYREPVESFETNIMGTARFLEAVRKVPSVQAAVVVTSDKCYENREWVYAYRENDAMGGYDPYSASKGCAELVTAAYRNSFFREEGAGIASARAGNVIGGGDWALDRLVPDCIRALSKGETIILRNPQATRPWQHVLEPLSGYLTLAWRLAQDKQRYASGWNFGPADADVLSVLDVVKQVIALWGQGGYEVRSQGEPHEAQLLRLDIGRARTLLQWKPVYSAALAIQESVRWYRAREEAYSSLPEFTLAQIERYVQAAQTNGLFWAECVS
ncbi:MAG: CDP-glucose 4,6-dehydratase [Spirochaetota bacterium]|jgi:CDP-glucose 4,6-dehydratase|nr:CDP-glucose 4,6-dehydratase [Spirochaetota bacterium]